MPKLVLPNHNGAGPDEEIDFLRTVVIVGPNGAGKSKLGYWIEQHQSNTPVHRVGAQRSLVFSEQIQPRPLESAEAALYYGHDDPKQKNKIHRWGGDPQFVNSFLLHDYDPLLSLLFAHENKRDKDYTHKSRTTKAWSDIPDSKLDVVQRIWKEVMPQRELVVGDDKIETRKAGGNVYSARATSDGERVTLYLIGQSISAQADSIVVVDEPEIHLHRAIQALLWDKVEAARADCSFVYITHDLDFAATRVTAPKIIVSEFDGTYWKWQRVPSSSAVPEEALLTILGSRRRVLFVEGDEGSLDVGLLRAVYPERCIIPRGGCEKVIESTKAMRNLVQLHNLTPAGLVDRDYRTNAEVDALQASGIVVAEVSEIENLFLVPEVIAIVAKKLALDVEEVGTAVETFVLRELQNELEQQILNRTVRELAFRLSGFGAKAKTADELRNAFDVFKKEVNLEVLYSENKRLFQGIIADNNYKRAIKFYNRKSLANRASQFLKLAPDSYPERVLRFAATEIGPDLIAAFKQYLPSL